MRVSQPIAPAMSCSAIVSVPETATKVCVLNNNRKKGREAEGRVLWWTVLGGTEGSPEADTPPSRCSRGIFWGCLYLVGPSLVTLIWSTG